MQINHREWSTRYVLGLLGLALFWAAESFVIQATAFDGVPTNLHPITYQTVRFGLNLATAGIVLLLLSRRWLIVLAVGDFIISAVIIPYNHYFHHSLDVQTVRTVGEGLRVAGFGLKVVPVSWWAALVCSLAVKIFWIRRITPQPAVLRWRLAAGCALAGVALVGALQFTTFNFSQFRVECGNRGVYAYGYLNSWIAEAFLAPDMREVARRLTELQGVSPDRLSASESRWPWSRRIAVVQMESVGWNVLNLKLSGQEVTPYLNKLARSSRVFCIQAYHNVGSADMDYAVLSGGTPYSALISYEVPGLSYTNDLPHFMKKHGFHTVAIHGDDGGFFNRRPNFVRMGFDEIWFKEDFHNRPVQMSSWGVRDADLFKLSSKKMREDAGPQFHFIITLDSHAPFNLINDDEKEIFPHSTVWQENYFNSLRVLDNGLRDYIESLPAGTLVILYGDHTAGVTYGDYHSKREGAAEFVPCIVHVCQAGDSWVAMADPPGALAEDLRIHDVINVLRRQIAGGPQGAPAKSGH